MHLPRSLPRSLAAHQLACLPACCAMGVAESLAANEVPSSNKKVRRFANGFEIEEVKMVGFCPGLLTMLYKF